MNEENIIQQMKRAGIDEVVQLPCDRLKRLIPMVAENFPTVDLSREEVGVGICAGTALAGKRPAMMIQSTGAGTLLNALLSLTGYYRLPLPMLISWRGHYKEGIEAQVPLGKVLPDIFTAAGIETVRIETSGQIPLVGDAIGAAFEKNIPMAILLSPRIFESDNGSPASPEPPSIRVSRGEIQTQLNYETTKACGTMTRFDAIRTVAPLLADSAIVVNIGVPCKEYHQAADGPSVFYMLGSLGLASAIGLGIARHTPRKVAVIDGDGSLLMTPNILQHLADYEGDNLTVLAIDNGVYGSTGGQATAAASGGIDLELLARAYGIRDTAWTNAPAHLAALLAEPVLPRLIHAMVRPGNAPAGNVALDSVSIKERFMGWLNG